MSGDVIPFTPRRPVTGAALLIQRRRRETDEALRQFVEAEQFFRDWLAAFQEECERDADFQVHMGLV